MRRAVNILFDLGDEVRLGRTSVLFLIDLSGSMQGEPLESVKKAVPEVLKPMVQFHSELGSPVTRSFADQVLLMTFHTEIQRVCPWVDEGDFDFFRECFFAVDEFAFRGTGQTRLYDALIDALGQAYDRAKPGNERVIILFSDGGEYGSTKTQNDLNNAIHKCRCGFIERQRIESLLTKYGSGMETIFHSTEGDELLFREWPGEDALPKLFDEPDRQCITQLWKERRRPVKVYGLHFGNPGGVGLMDDLAHRTGGKCYHASDPSGIPSILEEISSDIVFKGHPSIRSRFLTRLSRAHFSRQVEGGRDWFRVISFNSEHKDQRHPQPTGQNPARDMFHKHPIFRLLLQGEEAPTREQIISRYRSAFSGPGHEDRLKSELMSNLRAMVLDQGHYQGIDDSPLFVLAFRGNNLAATSLLPIFVDMIQDFKRTPLFFGNPERCVVMVAVLLDDFVSYSSEAKRNLYALLTEVENMTDRSEVHGVFFVGDRNDSPSNDASPERGPSGFPSLRGEAFDDLVVETLFNLNLNQGVIEEFLTTIVGQGRVAAGGRVNRYAAIGNLSLFLDVDGFVRRSAGLFAIDLLRNMFDCEVIKGFPDEVEARVSTLFETIRFPQLKSDLLGSGREGDLFHEIDSPDIRLLSWYGREKRIRVPGPAGGGGTFREISLLYTDEVDYLQRLLFDVREYVESCHSVVRFSAEIDRRLEDKATEVWAKIRSITDDEISKRVDYASPVQAELWISKIKERIEGYLEHGFQNDLAEDVDYREAEKEFEKTTTTGGIIRESEISFQGVFDKLREKIESFPLASAVLTKYGILGVLLFSGVAAMVSGFGLPFSAYLLSIVGPAVWGLGYYKMHQARAQLWNLMDLYTAYHRCLARRQALAYLRTKLQRFYENALTQVARPPEELSETDPFFPDKYSETEMLRFFKETITDSLSTLIGCEAEGTGHPSPFHISVTGNPEVMGAGPGASRSEQFEVGYPGTHEIDWNDWMRRVLGTEGDIVLDGLAYVDAPFVPDLTSVDSGLRVKLHVTTVTPDTKYRIFLLQELSPTEQEQLKKAYVHREWESTVTRLVTAWAATRPRVLRQANILALWRDVALYHIWLLKLRSIVQSQRDDDKSLGNDALFDLWRRIYGARKTFRTKLSEVLQAHWRGHIAGRVSLWRLVGTSCADQDRFFNLVCGYSFPPMYYSAEGAQPPTYSRLYLSSKENTFDVVRQNAGFDLEAALRKSRGYSWRWLETAEGPHTIYLVTLLVSLGGSFPALRNLHDEFAGVYRDQEDLTKWRQYFTQRFLAWHDEVRQRSEEITWPFGGTTKAG